MSMIHDHSPGPAPTPVLSPAGIVEEESLAFRDGDRAGDDIGRDEEAVVS